MHQIKNSKKAINKSPKTLLNKENATHAFKQNPKMEQNIKTEIKTNKTNNNKWNSKANQNK